MVQEERYDKSVQLCFECFINYLELHATYVAPHARTAVGKNSSRICRPHHFAHQAGFLSDIYSPMQYAKDRPPVPTECSFRLRL